ncbi:MAG: GGDEF domain-containing protein [Spirochaetes bacterium]|nr:GGDEF domain-containing protein [Spirochaetota bacterium]
MKALPHFGDGTVRSMSTGAAAGFAAAVLGILGYAFFGPPGGAVAAIAAAAFLAVIVRLGGIAIGNAHSAPAASATGSGEPKTIPPDRLDALTGLANANGLSAWLSEKAGRMMEDGRGIIVLTADLDDYPQLEKRYGTTIADAVLIEVAKRVSVFAGGDGIAARTGTDEFAAIATVVPSRATELAEERAGQMVEMICRPVELSSQTVWISGAVGGASGSPRDGEKVLERARRAIVQARRLGRGRFFVDKG